MDKTSLASRNFSHTDLLFEFFFFTDQTTGLLIEKTTDQKVISNGRSILLGNMEIKNKTGEGVFIGFVKTFPSFLNRCLRCDMETSLGRLCGIKTNLIWFSLVENKKTSARKHFPYEWLNVIKIRMQFDMSVPFPSCY